MPLNPLATAWTPALLGTAAAAPQSGFVVTASATQQREESAPQLARIPSALSSSLRKREKKALQVEVAAQDPSQLRTGSAASEQHDCGGTSSTSGDSDDGAEASTTTVASDAEPPLCGALPSRGSVGSPSGGGCPPTAEENEEALATLQLEMDEDEQEGMQCSVAKVGIHDFDLLRIVGQGAFGKVFQVRHKATKQVYALKVMKKSKILQGNHADNVKSERDLLTSVSHPYIVTLRFSFQTPHKLYLVLDFINGGHLFFHLYREGVFSEDVARLYTAQIVCAVSYLHANNIMHRDLKPENCLLDAEGHLRLTDFGLAKGNMHGENERTNSLSGTLEYMAPEVVEGKGYTKMVDWWSVGILLYEMLCGQPPFRAKSMQVLQQQILSAKPKYPKFLSSEALSLLKGLLTRDPDKRLTADAIRRHPFFRAIDWRKLELRQIESRFKPSVRCSECVENFDRVHTDQPPEDSPCGTPNAGLAGEALFPNFSYVAPSFLLGVKEAKPTSPLAP